MPDRAERPQILEASSSGFSVKMAVYHAGEELNPYEYEHVYSLISAFGVAVYNLFKLRTKLSKPFIASVGEFEKAIQAASAEIQKP